LKWGALSVHFFTAAGAFAGLLALERAIAGAYPAMFGWLALALLIDGIDGTLARRLDIRRVVPHVDGDMLDAVVDYLTYVIVPLAAVWNSGMMSGLASMILLPLAASASALYFADRRMKTNDSWFRGFPGLWNVIALYLFVFPMPGWIVACVCVLGIIAMFVPIAFVHPVRVRQFRFLTILVTVLWGVSAVWLVYRQFGDAALARFVMLAAVVYFILLPLARDSIWARDDGY